MFKLFVMSSRLFCALRLDNFPRKINFPTSIIQNAEIIWLHLNCIIEENKTVSRVLHREIGIFTDHIDRLTYVLNSSKIKKKRIPVLN